MTRFDLAYIISACVFILFLSTTFIMAMFSSVSLLDVDAYAQSDYQKITLLFFHPQGLWSSSLIPQVGGPESPNTCDPGFRSLLHFFLCLLSRAEALDILLPGSMKP